MLPPLSILGNPILMLRKVDSNLDLLVIRDPALKRIRTLEDRREIALVSLTEWDLQLAIHHKVREVGTQPQLGDHLEDFQSEEQIVQRTVAV